MVVRSVPISMAGVIIIILAAVIVFIMVAPMFNIRVGREACRLVMGTIGGIGGLSGELAGAGLQARCDWLTF